MPRLNLLSIKCFKNEEITGPDETYLQIDGVTRWGPVSMNDGDGLPLTNIGAIDFTSSVKIDLYDADTGVNILGAKDKDDHLGTLYATAEQAGQGEKRDFFKRYGVNYELTWRVDP